MTNHPYRGISLDKPKEPSKPIHGSYGDDSYDFLIMIVVSILITVIVIKLIFPLVLL